MLIKRLKLSGFKSFVDPAELHIEPGLTGIVGPNGCGKSNLLEAIRWVMGENSAKSMRGAGMSDVIFAGTERRPARNFAEVTLLAEKQPGEIVHLLDASGKTVVGGQQLAGNDDDDHELEIVRRIERDAGSAYRANGRDVRAKDISLIFADAATGAHSPALVSQGRIAAAIAAKPTERRQMLEEAAGISGLHVRRKDAEQKLRAAESNMARLDDIMADQDARAAHLRKQARAAERYKKLSDEILTAEGRLIYARWRDAKAAADLAKAQAQAAEERVGQEQEKLLAAQTGQRLLTNELADIRIAVEQSRQRNSDAVHRIAALTSQRQTMISRIADLQRQAARIADDRGREDRLTLDAVQALNNLREEAQKLAKELSALEQQQPAFQSAYDNAERAVRETEVELARATAESARIEADIRVADNMLAAANRQAEQLQQAKARLDSQQANLQNGAVLEQAVVANRQALETLAASIAALEQEQQANAAQQEQAASERQNNEAALSAAKAELSGLTSEQSALERDLKPGQTNNKAIDQIRVAKGYEKAMAAALGNDLDAAIGAGADDGTGGGDNIGADFYWSGKYSPGIAPPPKDTQPLADYIDSAPSALAARLGALFVADSDTGQSLAPGQRLVTKTGAMRRWDGLVSLSGHSGAAQRMERQNRLTELASIIADAQADIAGAQSALDQSLAQLQRLQARHNDVRGQLSALRNQEREELRSLDSAEFERKRSEERHAEIDERRRELDISGKETEAALSAAQAQRDALPDGSAQAGALAKVQQQSETMRSALQQAQAALALQEQDLTRTRERRAVVKAEIRGWEARSSEADQRLRDLVKRAEEISAETAKLDGEPERLEQEAAIAERERADIAETLATQEQKLSATEQSVRQAEQASAAAGEAMAQARETRAAAATRAENAETRRIEMGRISGERFECPPQLLPARAGFDEEDVGETKAESAELERLTASRERLGPVNLVAADELEELELETATAREEHQELITAIAELRGSISSLNREGRARLRSAFEEVDNHFQRLFVRLFNGGKAHLALIDSDDPLEAGLEIMAQPPGKKLASLTLLSGGEQALTAIALIFALFLTNPAPICVLDEVDAPLDDANIDRFCDLLDQMARETDTRYLIVTHNAVTMSRMHRLFGVTMIEKGISRLVSVDLGGAEELLAAE